MNGFMLFLQNFRNRIRAENPDMTMSQVSIIAGKEWGRTDKAVWNLKAKATAIEGTEPDKETEPYKEAESDEESDQENESDMVTASNDELEMEMSDSPLDMEDGWAEQKLKPRIVKCRKTKNRTRKSSISTRSRSRTFRKASRGRAKPNKRKNSTELWNETRSRSRSRSPKRLKTSRTKRANSSRGRKK